MRLEGLAKGLNETSIKETRNSMVPNFAKNIKATDIKSFKEADKPIHIKCRNEKLAFKRHPNTNIKYRIRTVKVNGEKIEGTFPKFKSTFDTKISNQYYKDTNATQFKLCNNALKKSVDENPLLKFKFNKEQLNGIKEGKTPIGYTWHHNETPGNFQLVNSEIHKNTGHTGGKSIWGSEINR